jgi:hypothetical protein
MRLWISACLCLTTLFLTEAKAQIIFGDGPNQYLKGIDAIHYWTYFESGMAGSSCAIKFEEWNNSLKFVADQSVRLKLIQDEKYHNRLHELSNKVSSVSSSDVLSSEQGAKTWQAAMKELQDYGSIPELRITVTPIELESGGCAGTLGGELIANVAPTHIIATQKEVGHPTVEIWAFGHILKGPYQDFSRFMISNGEQLIKKLVNSWTESQTLFSSIDDLKAGKKQ